MSRRLFPLFASLTLGLCLLAGCGPSIKTKEKVREDLLAHLQKAGLDTQALEIDITGVKFEKDQAHAAVSFRPKTASNIHDGIMMNYTLQSRDGHWVVIGRADSQGHGAGQPSGGDGAVGSLPQGHPPVSEFDSPNVNPHGMATPLGTQPLPPGHPRIDPQGADGAASPDEAKPLPTGHPKVSQFEREIGTRIAAGLPA